MVQIIGPIDRTPTESSASMIGKALGTGVSKNFEKPEQRVQRDLLADAMKAMEGETTYEGKLRSILPTLSTTPGGSEILSALMPLMQRQSAAEAYDKYYQDTQQGEAPIAESPRLGQEGAGQPVDEGLKGKESKYPSRTTGSEPVPLMTPQEKNQKRRELNRQYNSAGVPIDPAKIEQIIQQEDQNRIQYNEQQQKEKGVQAQAWDKMAEQSMTRFNNANLGKSPEDETVFKKFVNEARNKDNPNEIYEYARDKYRQFENARNAITNEMNLPGPITKAIRQYTGTYKSKEDLISSLQPHIKKLIDMNLIPEARNLLSNSLGFGTDDVERTLFPPSKEVTKQLNMFSPNPDRGKVTGLFTDDEARFPGEESALKDKNYDSFKGKVENLISKNPEINLINLRSQLNQQKGYGWQDINRVVVELIDEGRFKPNDIQEQQLNVIKQAPLPGLLEMFKNVWTGKK